MNALDPKLKQIRFPTEVLQLLAANKVTDSRALLESKQLLDDIRKYLNPIQLSKLNTLINDGNNHKADWTLAADIGVGKSTREEIVLRLEDEQRCLELLNTPIGAALCVQQAREEHQRNIKILNALLEPQQSTDVTVTAESD